MNYHLVAIPMPTVFLIVMLWLCKMKCVLPILWKLMVSLASTYQDMYLTNGVSFEQESDNKIIWTWFCDILKWQYLFLPTQITSWVVFLFCFQQPRFAIREHLRNWSDKNTWGWVAISIYKIQRFLCTNKMYF